MWKNVIVLRKISTQLFQKRRPRRSSLLCIQINKKQKKRMRYDILDSRCNKYMSPNEKAFYELDMTFTSKLQLCNGIK